MPSSVSSHHENDDVISRKAAAIPHRIEIMRECLLLEQHGVDHVKPAEKAANDGPGDRMIVGVGTARRDRRQTPEDKLQCLLA